MAPLKETLHRHTPRGRYEEYRKRHDETLDQTAGPARYALELEIDRDAKRYARNAVIKDICVTAGIVASAVYGFKRFKDSGFNVHGALQLIQNDAAAVGAIPGKVWKSVNNAASQLGASFGRGVGQELQYSSIEITKSVSETLDHSGGTAKDIRAAAVALRTASGKLQTSIEQGKVLVDAIPSAAASLSGVLDRADGIVDKAHLAIRDVRPLIDGSGEIVDGVNLFTANVVGAVDLFVAQVGPIVMDAKVGLRSAERGLDSAHKFIAGIPTATGNMHTLLGEMDPRIASLNRLSLNTLLAVNKADLFAQRLAGADWSIPSILRYLIRGKKR